MDSKSEIQSSLDQVGNPDWIDFQKSRDASKSIGGSGLKTSYLEAGLRIEDLEGIEDIDSGIRDLIEDLNSSGFITEMSCQGDSPRHQKLDPGFRNIAAWIHISGALEKMTRDELKELKSIIRSHTSVPFVLRRLGSKDDPESVLRVQFLGSL